jgi:hypothetical protein
MTNSPPSRLHDKAPADDGPSNRWFAHLRGLLVALHLAAITLMALPAPEGGMNRNAWKDPTVQGELAAWTERFNEWGITVTQPELEDGLWRLAVDYMAVRNEIVSPFRLYYECCGTSQSWRMFVAPHRYPTRLHIDLEEHGQWRPLYVERTRKHDWLSSKLDQHRFRSAIFRFGWDEFTADYRRFVDWIARQAARDFPEADRVRVRLYKYRSPSPEEVRQGQHPEGEFIKEEVRRLEGFR